MEGTYYADVYVAPCGNDHWSGRLAEPNAAGTDGPVASLEQARKLVQALLPGLKRDAFVLIRGGHYPLDKTVIFGPEDSHRQSYQVIYSAYPGEEPVFSGDLSVGPWRKAGPLAGLPPEAQGFIWEADLPATVNTVYTMYDQGQLLQRACSKGLEPTKTIPCNDGFWDWKEMEQADKFSLYYPEGALKDWDNLGDIEVFIQPTGFVTNYLGLLSVDVVEKVAKTRLPATYSMSPLSRHSHAAGLGGSFRVENALEYLSQPGMWVVNSKEGKLYYWPKQSEPGDQITVPALTELVRFQGDETAGSLVRQIVLRGLTFTRGERDVLTAEDIGLQHDWEMWNKPNALVRFVDTDSCTVDSCRFTNSAGTGLRFDLYSQNNRVQNCLFDYIGGCGIVFCGYGPGRKDVNKHNWVLNNQVHHCGEFLYHSPAIMLWQSGYNTVQHNKLHHLPYDGIILSGVRTAFFNIKRRLREMTGTIRWSEIPQEAKCWQQTDLVSLGHQWHFISPFMHTRENRIEDNEIFLNMQRLFDGNAIYLSDTGCNNLIRRNYIHHLNGQGMQQGIRTDSYIKKTTIRDNIVFNCNGGGINVKYYDNHVLNNIVADIHDIIHEYANGHKTRIYIGYVSMLDVWERERVPENSSTRIQHNIFYKTDPQQTFFRQKNVDGVFVEANVSACDIDHNVYFDRYAADRGASSLARYRSLGQDQNSTATDPLFVDLDTGDFRLRPDSPASDVGFRPIDVAQIGLRHWFPDRFRAVVQVQLGRDYDQFQKLQQLCRKTDSSDAEQEDFQFE